MPISIVIDVLGADQLAARLGAAPEVANIEFARAMRDTVLAVEAAAKARVPRRTGRLFSSISSEVAGDTGRVWTGVSYAPMVEFGTRPHEISAVNGRALMLPIHPMAGRGGPTFGGARLSGAPRAGQQVAFFRRVHHPGTKGAHFMRDAANVGELELQSRFRVGAESVVASIARS